MASARLLGEVDRLRAEVQTALGVRGARADLLRTVEAIRACRPNEDTPEARAAAHAALDILPPKWEEMFGRDFVIHGGQIAARTSTARFRAIEAGRRSGKTAD